MGKQKNKRTSSGFVMINENIETLVSFYVVLNVRRSFHLKILIVMRCRISFFTHINSFKGIKRLYDATFCLKSAASPGHTSADASVYIKIF